MASRKGIPNRSTAKVRDAVSRIAEHNIEKVQEWLEAIEDPKHRLDLFVRLLEYHIPKLARTELTGEDGNEIKIESITRTIIKP